MGKARFSTARKRQKDESFTEVRPLKRGRTEISKSLQKQIVEAWLENSRAGANLHVCNPKNQKEKRDGLRLRKPALHVVLSSKLVKTKMNPMGKVSRTTFNKYRPYWVLNPVLSDGLCKHCQDRRLLIDRVHHQFPETNPEFECKEREQNKGWHLEKWDQNSTAITLDALLNKFDPLFEHPLRKNDQKAKKFETVLNTLKAAETHFRLSLAYIKRDRAIKKDFCSALGKEWLRITHDCKNPLVIGEGGVDAGETTGQKRNLGICSCVGAMMQYAGPRGTKEPYVAFVSNLSLNPDKNSYANLEHLFHSLTQSPFKEIMQDKE